MSHWEPAQKKYGKLVGEKGHYYHQTLIIPNTLRLLSIKPKDSLLDLGCGNGVLARHIPNSVTYVGIDGSKGLIAQAKKQTPSGEFLVGDCTKPLPTTQHFDAACFILSLQNMDHGEAALKEAAKHLKPGAKLLLVLNHPAFRIPRQTDWVYDEDKKLMFRKVNSYMNPLKIPIAMEPSKEHRSPTTFSFHHPISTYITWLTSAGLSTTAMEEWCSDKKSEGSRAKAEDRARLEFPMFLALLAEKR